MDNKVLEFTCTIVRKVWADDSSSYRIYATNVDEDTCSRLKLKHSKYGNVVIAGTLHELSEGLDYHVKAVETFGKNGYSYKVLNISRNRPKDSEEMYFFLKEVITERQAKILWEVYPDIVQRVIDNKLDDVDLNKTCGIKEASFAVIKRKIIENYTLAEMVVEFKGLFSMTMVQKLYNKYTSVYMLKSRLREDPYSTLCAIEGVGFKTADSIALELEKEKLIYFPYDLKTSVERCLCACLYLLNENESNGNTRMDLLELKKQVEKLVPACSHNFANVLKSQDIYYDKSKMIVALRRTYEIEDYVSRQLLRAIKIKCDQWDVDTSKYTIVDGFELNKEQKMVNTLLCTNQVVVLAGYAGSGKSFSVQSVLNMCKANNKSYLPLSSSGKAAKVLAEYIGEDAMTIHRGLGYPSKNYPCGWEYNVENKLAVDLVIVDEFSMVDVFLFKHIIDAIDFTKTKLLLVGDHEQIPSISAGNCLFSMINSNIIPKTILTKIHRYSDGGLMMAATDVRNGRQYLNDVKSVTTTFGKDGDYTFIMCKDEDMVKSTLALYKKLLSKAWQEKKGIHLDVADIQVLTAKNVGPYGTIMLNNELQKIVNPNYGSETFYKVGKVVFYEDDLVMQLKNNYKAELYANDMVLEDELGNTLKTFIANGETGVIKEINKQLQYVVIDFNGIQVRYGKEEMQSVSLSYACTAHKSQGSGIKVPIILEPRSHIFMDSSGLLYVQLTRTKLMCFHLGLPQTVNMAIRKKDTLKRNTFMLEMLASAE